MARLTRRNASTPRSPGRPRLNRDRHAFRPGLDPAAHELLVCQAALVGLPLSTYAEVLVAEAHGYVGQYLATLDSLPTVITASQLRDRVRSRTALQCPETSLFVYTGVKIAVDRPLADQIDEACAVLDVTFASYLRALIYDAVGYHPASEHFRDRQVAAAINGGELLVKAS